MSARWCSGSIENEYAGPGGHWMDETGLHAPYPIKNCICTPPERLIFASRLSFDLGAPLRNPSNPVLAFFRIHNEEYRDGEWPEPATPGSWIAYSERYYSVPMAHIHHARRVLARLATLSAVSS